jgi:hypothetical protein
MPDKLWPAFNHNWPLLNQLFACAANTLLRGAKKWVLKSACTGICQFGIGILISNWHGFSEY